MPVLQPIQTTPELRRILALPRRDFDETDPRGLAGKLTPILRTRYGAMSLRGIQALALFEAWRYRGLFASIGVGKGKTLISFLAPVLLASCTPFLLLPAGLIAKAEREFLALAQHWRLPVHRSFISYESLGLVQNKHMLDPEHPACRRPDLIVADEAHALKDPTASRTKSVARYMAAFPETVFIALSGSFIKDSLMDYAHILRWCIPPMMRPLPHSWSELTQWASVLDPEKDTENWREDETKRRVKCSPGALWSFLPISQRGNGDDLTLLRQAYGKRLGDTPGIVRTTSRFSDASLRIDKIELPRVQLVHDHLRYLRDTWRTPDEWPLFDAPLVRMAALEIILGWFGVWNPRPPPDWLAARKSWASACRGILKDNRRNLDSEKMVVSAVDAGFYPDASALLRQWRDIKDTFTPQTEAVWFSDHALRAVEKWAAKHKRGVIWTKRVEFGERVAKHLGVPYFGEGGICAEDGRDIELSKDPLVVASIDANGKGRNLQQWDRALVTEWQKGADRTEQLLGRLHRSGQRSDVVNFDLFVGCLEHVRAWNGCINDAKANQATLGQEQKILFADVVFDSREFEGRTGPEWEKP